MLNVSCAKKVSREEQKVSGTTLRLEQHGLTMIQCRLQQGSNHTGLMTTYILTRKSSKYDHKADVLDQVDPLVVRRLCKEMEHTTSTCKDPPQITDSGSPSPHRMVPGMCPLQLFLKLLAGLPL